MILSAILDFNARAVLSLESVYISTRAPGHTVYQITPQSHTPKGASLSPLQLWPSIAPLSFFLDPQVTCPIQLPFRLLSMDHVPPEHSPFSLIPITRAFSLSLFPPWWCPWAPICAAVPVVLWIHYVLLTVLFVLYSHTHTHTHTHTLLYACSLSPCCKLSQSFGWGAWELDERERKKTMCMCVWVCECDLHPRVAGFLIRGQGPHCSDKGRDGDRGLLETLPEETLSYATDTCALKERVHLWPCEISSTAFMLCLNKV